MNFDFSDDQKFLKNEARKFLDANCTTARVRKVLDDDHKAYDEDLWKAVAGQGWLGAAIPEEHGGLGLGHIELCAIAEELGRAVAPIPFASTVYFLAEAIMLAGSDEQKAKWLPRIAASEAFWFAAKENIQTHGGIGFTWEVDAHLYYRRSRQLSLVAGAPRVWKERLVSHLERRNAA